MMPIVSLLKKIHIYGFAALFQKYFPTLTFLTNHKRLMHPTTRGQPRKQRNSSFDNISLLPSQQKKGHMMKWNLNQELIIQIENEYKRCMQLTIKQYMHVLVNV